MTSREKILPNSHVLRGIFPDLPSISAEACTVILKTFDTHTTRLQIPTPPLPKYPTGLVIRLEKAGSPLPAVVGLQRLAYDQLSNLYSETSAVSSTTNPSESQLDYLVILFLDGTGTLEDVLNDLEPENCTPLMDVVVAAVEKLQ